MMRGQGGIGTRLADSEPAYFEYPKPPAGAPNVVMIVLDDVGFAQLGCYGAGIDTPNIDRLAAGGLRYNRFHVTAICSSTRACLLTGRNHHAVGVGLTQEQTIGFPGYTGRIPKSAATLARVLRDTGYSTLAVGKWHLAGKGELSASGPMDRWPLGLGFERFYGFLGAETNQWAPELVRDNSHVDAPRTPAEGYHLTEDLADEVMRMILDQQHATPDKPFFCYFSTGAAHSPHQVAREWIERYQGRFDHGWDDERREVFARQIVSGIVPAGTSLTERPPWVPDWSGLSTDERRLYARYMEVFAGFMSHTDAQIGRVVDFLERRGILDDTVVVLLSDNGASSEGSAYGTLNEAESIYGIRQDLDEALQRIDDIGGHRATNHYPWGWAWAGNTPLHLWKRYTWLGGTRTPLVVHWPAGIADGGAVRSPFCHAVDLMPTILDVVGIDAPAVVDGVTQQRIDGSSMAKTFVDAGAAEHHPIQYFEMHGSRSIYQHGWKATTSYVSPFLGERAVIDGSADFDDDHWALFDLTEDFAETVDLSAKYPERVRAMEQLWWAEAGRNQVLPLFEGSPSTTAAPQPWEYPPPSTAVYEPGGGPITGTQLPNMLGGFTITAEVELGDVPAQGVLCALGDLNGGFALYLLDGRPVVHFAVLGGRCQITSPDVVPAGRRSIALKCTSGEGSTITLEVDGEPVGSVVPPGPVHFLSISSCGVGLLVGRDRGLAVSDDYEPPFAFTGTLHRLEMRSTKPDATYDQRAIVAALRSD